MPESRLIIAQHSINWHCTKVQIAINSAHEAHHSMEVCVFSLRFDICLEYDGEDIVWAQHGIYGANKDLDETFGLIETAEKAAEI
ncbi:MAG: class II aldolase/adducin family protein [Clostridia bacterium]|nr:class II aldolase/adducin family protein [Clostridia bacterium]